MKHAYHWRLFLEHWKKWVEKYRDLQLGITDMPEEHAEHFRICLMLEHDGITGDVVNFMVPRIILAQKCLNLNIETFKKEGLVSFHVPNEIANVSPAVLVAIHQAIQREPLPRLAEIDVTDLISDAKGRCAKWVGRDKL